MSTVSRKEELEKKKAKLALIREEKKKREEEKRQKEMATEVYSTLPDFNKIADADDVLKELGISAPSAYTNGLDGLNEFSMHNSSDISNTTNKLRTTIKLGLSSVTQTNIPSKEKVYYNKETQINLDVEHATEKNRHIHDYYVLTYGNHDENEFEDATTIENFQNDPNLLRHSLHSGLPKVDMIKANLSQQNEVYELPEEEKDQIMSNPCFHKFLAHSARIVERALHEDYDITIDYSGNIYESEISEIEKNRLQLNTCMYDELRCKNRSITCLDWGHQFPELLAASYYRNDDSSQDPDGLVLVWNTRFKNMGPEYTFNFQSTVSSVAFAKYLPNILIGGCYSGQIVLWDNRVDKRTPVQRSPFSTKGHTHPVYSVTEVGPQNANAVISVSTDGKLSTWSLDMLSAPVECLDLQNGHSKVLPVTALAFPHNNGEGNAFVVGSEEGLIFSGCRHGAKNGILEMYEGHKGPVTDIHFNSTPAYGAHDFSHLFLSASTDWSVKLWSTKNPKPLFMLDDYDAYIYGAQWSPSHPGTFACITGAGDLDLWKLTSSTENPITSEKIGDTALTRLKWSRQGHNIAVGDDTGRIHLYDVGEYLAQPQPEDWGKFGKLISELESTSNVPPPNINSNTTAPLLSVGLGGTYPSPSAFLLDNSSSMPNTVPVSVSNGLGASSKDFQNHFSNFSSLQQHHSLMSSLATGSTSLT